MLRLLLVAAAIAAGAVAFAPSAARPCRAPQLARRRMAVADTPPEEEDPKRKKTPIEVDEAQLSVLQRRVNALRKAEETATELDLIVLDSMLPGQVLSFKCSKSVLGTLPLPGGFCGMLGVDPRTNTAQPYGSEVEVTAREPYGEEPDVFEVTVRATRVFKIDTEAAVLGEDKGNRKRVLWQTYDDDEDTALEAAACTKLASLVERWLAAVVANDKQRVPDHLDIVLGHLGPAPRGASEYAIWAAALLNPIPALGVAWEIRPPIMKARTALAKLELAESAFITSLAHIELGKPLF